MSDRTSPHSTKCSGCARHDQILGVLPFFHSFGYTVTLWAVLCLDCGAAYHFNPLEAGIIGRLCREEHVTIIVGTPTTLRNYLKRCPAEEFKSVEVVVCGAERLPPELADAFEAKFGLRPVEGYGTTELSPIVAVNVPPASSAGGRWPWLQGGHRRPSAARHRGESHAS